MTESKFARGEIGLKEGCCFKSGTGSGKENVTLLNYFCLCTSCVRFAWREPEHNYD
jgi:hypothetical protein